MRALSARSGPSGASVGTNWPGRQLGAGAALALTPETWGSPPMRRTNDRQKPHRQKNQILNVTTGLPFGCTGAKSSNASSCVNALPRRRTAAPPRQEEARTSARTAGQWISARGARLKGLRTPFVCSLKPPKKGYDAPPPKTNSEGSFVVPRASRTDSPAPIIGPRRYSASSTRGWIPA